jgi:hypothetical protein
MVGEFVFYTGHYYHFVDQCLTKSIVIRIQHPQGSHFSISHLGMEVVKERPGRFIRKQPKVQGNKSE